MSRLKIKNNLEFKRFCNELKAKYKITREEYNTLKEMIDRTVVLPCKIGEPCIVLERCYCHAAYRYANCKKSRPNTKYIAFVHLLNGSSLRHGEQARCLKMFERSFKLAYLDEVGKTVFIGPTAKEDAMKKMKELGEVTINGYKESVSM